MKSAPGRKLAAPKHLSRPRESGSNFVPERIQSL